MFVEQRTVFEPEPEAPVPMSSVAAGRPIDEPAEPTARLEQVLSRF